MIIIERVCIQGKRFFHYRRKQEVDKLSSPTLQNL
jgi:hypothetical protein